MVLSGPQKSLGLMLKGLKLLLAATCLGFVCLFSLPVTAGKLLVTPEEEYCLALNDYYEARGEPIEGRLGVAYVVLNRVKAKHYPKTICEVIYQRNEKRCAFSWVCAPYPITEPEAWQESQRFSKQFLAMKKYDSDPTGGAVFYHEVSINPYWTAGLQDGIVLGEHIFYRR